MYVCEITYIYAIAIRGQVHPVFSICKYELLRYLNYLYRLDCEGFLFHNKIVLVVYLPNLYLPEHIQPIIDNIE